MAHTSNEPDAMAGLIGQTAASNAVLSFDEKDFTCSSLFAADSRTNKYLGKEGCPKSVPVEKKRASVERATSGPITYTFEETGTQVPGQPAPAPKTLLDSPPIYSPKNQPGQIVYASGYEYSNAAANVYGQARPQYTTGDGFQYTNDAGVCDGVNGFVVGGSTPPTTWGFLRFRPGGSNYRPQFGQSAITTYSYDLNNRQRYLFSWTDSGIQADESEYFTGSFIYYQVTILDSATPANTVYTSDNILITVGDAPKQRLLNVLVGKSLGTFTNYQFKLKFQLIKPTAGTTEAGQKNVVLIDNIKVEPVSACSDDVKIVNIDQ